MMIKGLSSIQAPKGKGAMASTFVLGSLVEYKHSSSSSSSCFASQKPCHFQQRHRNNSFMPTQIADSVTSHVSSSLVIRPSILLEKKNRSAHKVRAKLYKGGVLQMQHSRMGTEEAVHDFGELQKGGNLQENDEFVEVGYVTRVHGLLGELHVDSTTDFPKARFEEPGMRWLKMRHMSNESIECVELVRGRKGPGKHSSWLITLEGITSPEKASRYVGSIILARVSERPLLEDGEFYIPDLVGLSVIKQDSGEKIGLIVDVYSTGACDLLKVRLHTKNNVQEVNGSAPLEQSVEETSPLIWIPFAKDIVPVVNLERKMIEITPPMGLLELNVHSKKTSKREQRKQETKDRRKLKEKLAGLKKNLARLKQDHILAGLKLGEENQRKALVEELLEINFTKLQNQLQDALNRSNSLSRFQSDSVDAFKDAVSFPQLAVVSADWLRREDCRHHLNRFTGDGWLEGSGNTARWCREGLRLIVDNKVAVVTLINEGVLYQSEHDCSAIKETCHLDILDKDSPFQAHAEQILQYKELACSVHPDAKIDVRWIVMTTSTTDCLTRLHFQENDFFGFQESQVWFCRAAKLPCFEHDSASGHHRILMETPWKIAQSYIGDGAVFSSLIDQALLEKLAQEGRDYLQVCNVSCADVRALDPALFGCLHDLRANVGIQVGKRYSDQAGGVTSSQVKTTCSDVEAQRELVGGTEERSAMTLGHALNDPASLILRDSQSVFGDDKTWDIYFEPEEVLSEKDQGREPVLQLHPYGNYVISSDYLMHLEKHQRQLEYNICSTKILTMVDRGSEGGDYEQSDAIQLNCSFFDFLRQSMPHTVAAIVCP